MRHAVVSGTNVNQDSHACLSSRHRPASAAIRRSRTRMSVRMNHHPPQPTEACFCRAVPSAAEASDRRSEVPPLRVEPRTSCVWIKPAKLVPLNPPTTTYSRVTRAGPSSRSVIGGVPRRFVRAESRVPDDGAATGVAVALARGASEIAGMSPAARSVADTSETPLSREKAPRVAPAEVGFTRRSTRASELG